MSQLENRLHTNDKIDFVKPKKTRKLNQFNLMTALAFTIMLVHGVVKSNSS